MPTSRATILSLAASEPATDDTSDTTSGCGTDGGCGSSCGTGSQSCSSSGPRVPVLVCRDALVAAGWEVTLATAASDQEIDAVIAQLDASVAAERPVPGVAGGPILIVATESDAQLRAVLRRMVRRYAPAPSKRPADLPDGRTIPDLPAIGVLPLTASTGDLADRLGLPRDGAAVARAVLAGTVRRVDLFRNDGGSITVHGALLGGVTDDGQAASWTGQVVVDDTLLTTGKEPVLACAVANGSGYARLDDIALAPHADPSNGTITVAVAVPVVSRTLLGRTRVRIEVRRASGRAVSVTPAADLPFLDDGVAGTLTRKRTWWIEPAAWGVFTG